MTRTLWCNLWQQIGNVSLVNLNSLGQTKGKVAANDATIDAAGS